jgi:hypothetical protein
LGEYTEGIRDTINHTKMSENLKVPDQLEELGITGIILKVILKNLGRMA